MTEAAQVIGSPGFSIFSERRAPAGSALRKLFVLSFETGPTVIGSRDSFIVGESAGLVTSSLRVRVPAGAAGEFSSPELIFCADSYSVSVPPRVTARARKRPGSFCQKCRWQVTAKRAHTLDPTKSEWADYAVQA